MCAIKKKKAQTYSELDYGPGIPVKAVDCNAKFGHLKPFDVIEVPFDHRKLRGNPHSLRCFRMKFQRDPETGEKRKDLPRVRCRNGVEKGYLYCKFHGGLKSGISKALVPAEPSQMTRTASVYRGLFCAELGNLFEAYLNDPAITDLKPELSIMRTTMAAYLKKLLTPPSVSCKSEFLNEVMGVLTNEKLNTYSRYDAIMTLAGEMETLTNGKSVDRISRCVTSIGQVIEKIRKIENDDKYQMTPEGLKVMLRSLVDIISANVKDEAEIKAIHAELLRMDVTVKKSFDQFHAGEVIDAEEVHGE